MIVTQRNETFYKVEMTAQQRQAVILGLLTCTENTLLQDSLHQEQKEALSDLRQSLLNAA